MDEIIFRGSQKLENFQIRLSIAVDEGKTLLQQFLLYARSSVTQLRNNEYLLQSEETLKHLWRPIVELSDRFKEIVIIHINTIYSDIKRLLIQKWTKENIYFACVGFFFGVVIGMVIVLVAVQRDETEERYMQTLQCTEYNGIESAVLIENSITPYLCGYNEVIINVKAASINVIDAKICNGYGKGVRSLLRNNIFKSLLPITLGRDCTGTVKYVGRGVHQIEIGDEVWATVPFWETGTCSQTIVVSEDKVSYKPRNVGFEASCSLPYSGTLVFSLLEKHKLTDLMCFENKKILIIGGCTPFGCILMQLLNSWNARVTATCLKKAEPVCRALGAHEVIIENVQDENDSNLENCVEKCILKELDIREQFHLIFITIDYNLETKKLQQYNTKDGIIISTLPKSLNSDSYGCILRFFYWIGIKIAHLFQCTILDNNEVPVSVFLDKLKELVENGKLQTVIDKVYPTTEIVTALRHIQSNDSIGSTIITFK